MKKNSTDHPSEDEEDEVMGIFRRIFGKSDGLVLWVERESSSAPACKAAEEDFARHRWALLG